MHEHPYLSELAGATSIGLLAEEMVFVISRLLREKARATEEDALVIAAGRALLDSIANPKPGGTRPGLNQLSGSEGALDAIQAVLVQAREGDAEAYVTRLVAALRAIEGRENVEGREDDLMEARDLFATVGRLSLSRANGLTRSPQERIGWLTSAATSTS